MPHGHRRRWWLFRPCDIDVSAEPRRQRNGQQLLGGGRTAAAARRRVRTGITVAVQQRQVRTRAVVGREPCGRRAARLFQARFLPESHHAADVVTSVQQPAGDLFFRNDGRVEGEGGASLLAECEDRNCFSESYRKSEENCMIANRFSHYNFTHRRP